jgi:hypothetical protein
MTPRTLGDVHKLLGHWQNDAMAKSVVLGALGGCRLYPNSDRKCVAAK